MAGSRRLTSKPETGFEKAYVARLAEGMVAQLADLGAVTRKGNRVVLTDLGAVVAAIADLSDDEEDDELDLVDTDALSLLSVRVEDEAMTLNEARSHLLAWTRARPDDEAADELCEAMLDDDNPDLWAAGLEALGMLDPAVAVPAVRRLRSHGDLRPLAAEWLDRHTARSAPAAEGRSSPPIRSVPWSSSLKTVPHCRAIRPYLTMYFPIMATRPYGPSADGPRLRSLRPLSSPTRFRRHVTVTADRKNRHSSPSPAFNSPGQP